MPSKPRWGLNPRKWFGAISGSTNKPNRLTETNHSTAPRFSRSTTTTTITTVTSTTKTSKKTQATSTAPKLLSGRSKTKVLPSSNIAIDDNNAKNSVSSYTQLQSIAVNNRREKTSVSLLGPKYPTHLTLLVPTRTEPSIPSCSNNKKLIVSTKKVPTEPIVHERTQISSSPSPQRHYSQKDPIDFVQSEFNISILSNECIIDYPQNSSNNLAEKYRSSREIQLSSSSEDNDARDESTSSGIFTDERTDTNDGLGPASKDTLSTLDIVSVESIDDSQTSLSLFQSNSFVQYYRLRGLLTEKDDLKSLQYPRPKPINRPRRENTVETIFKDNQINPPITIKNRQSSSAAIVKKIEKRVTTNRSPSATLDRVGLVRVANDTYRLAIDKNNRLYRPSRPRSIVQCSDLDDSLPPADDEEAYATIPRTSSTEQLNDSSPNDLRATIDDCLRPVVTSMNKIYRKSTRNTLSSKRLNGVNEPPQINIDEMVDKLLSSVDCSTYAQFQRC